MYITKDKNAQSFKWSRKGKNRECWVLDNKCIARVCFDPHDCGTVDAKTQQKNINGICRTYFEGKCPMINGSQPKIYK